jgi:signal peptidase I
VLNQIVLIRDFPIGEFYRISRIAGMPGDTVKMYNSVLYINNQRIYDNKSVSHTYQLITPNIAYALSFIKDHQISCNARFSDSAIIEFEADLERLKIMKSKGVFNFIRRKTEEKAMALMTINVSGDEIFKGKDYYGPIVIPRKNYSVDLNSQSFLLYADLIEYETGKPLNIEFNRVLIDGKPAAAYVFRNNYYFILNDKRSDYFDSRLFGPVPENLIAGTYLLKIK